MLYLTHLLDKWQIKQSYQIFHILLLELIYKQFLWVLSHLTCHLSSLHRQLNPLFCLCGLNFSIFLNMPLLGRLTQLSSATLRKIGSLQPFSPVPYIWVREVIKVDCMFQNLFYKLHKQLINFFENYSWSDIKFLILTKALFMTSSLFSRKLQISSEIS